MTTERTARSIDVRGIAVEVVRKEIKNLHVGVYPPHGRVRVAAPLRLDDDAVRLAIIARPGVDSSAAGPIRAAGSAISAGVRDRRESLLRRPALPARRGRARRSADGPSAQTSTMRLSARPGADRDAREAVLERWYRRQLRGQLPALRDQWERQIGVTVADVRIKKMKTLWGSCNVEARRIWLNLELAKKPTSCLAYVLVHEMIHLLERNHTDRFRSLMDQHLPQWPVYRDQLNYLPLAHEDWRY